MTMTPHDELDLLSSYLDEELDAPERARLEAHMTSCGECRSTLSALQSTVADLKTLPEPAPSLQDSWALRAAIRRARSPMRKWQRMSWAAGAVAAAAIAVFAFTLPGNNPSRDFAMTSAEDQSAVPIFQSGENLQELDAYGRLLSLAGLSGQRADSAAGGAAADPFLSGPTPAASTELKVVAPPTAAEFQSYSANTDERAAIGRCVDRVRTSTQEFLEPVRYEIATYESDPAYLLFFRTQDRYELWVVARESCDVLYFGQANAS